MKTNSSKLIVLTLLMVISTAMPGMSVRAGIITNLDVQPVTFTATEGTAASNITVATFTDPGEFVIIESIAGDGISNYTATIDWGDSTPSDTATLAENGSGGFDIIGTHTYTEHGSYSLTVSVSDTDGSSGSTNFTVNVFDAALVASGLTVAATEGWDFTEVVATFSDGNPYGTTNDFSATIDWGDGYTTSGIIETNPLGGFVVIGSYMYWDEGSFAVTVNISDIGGSTASAGSTVTVSDAPLCAHGKTICAVEGAAFTNTVAFLRDSNPYETTNDLSAMIYWGDGSSSEGLIEPIEQNLFVLGAARFRIIGSHTYTEHGSYAITVDILDAGGSTASAGSTAQVADAPLTATARLITPVENTAFIAVVASFVDGNPFGTRADFSASVDWGDGTISSGNILDNAPNGFLVMGSHTYTNQGLYYVAVKIDDIGGSTTTANSLANTADAPMIGTGTTIAAVEGVPFTNVVATCFDTDLTPEPETTYNCIINWGDGCTSSGSMSEGDEESYEVTGSHTYAQSGSYVVLVTIDNTQTFVSTSARSTVHVSDPPADNVTSQFIVRATRPHFDRRTGLIRQELIVKNVSRQSVSGPVSIVLDNLNNGGGNIALYNKDGEIVTVGAAPLGSPYKNVTLPKGNVFKGRTARNVVLFFDSSSPQVTYSPRVLAGPGAR